MGGRPAAGVTARPAARRVPTRGTGVNWTQRVARTTLIGRAAVAKKDALAELGHDAKPARLRGWIKENLDIEMTADHISTAKGEILRKQAGQKAASKPAAKGQAQQSAARTQERPAAAVEQGGGAGHPGCR